MANDSSLREHLLYLLDGGGAHLDFASSVKNLPARLRGACPEGSPHTLWQLVEHLRIAQWDILEFSRNPGHVSPKWPEGYWPSASAPEPAAAWEACLESIRADRQAMRDLVADPAADLLTPFAHGDGQTLLREALLIVDHDAYHLGQIVLLRKMLGDWPPAQ
jgi:hypothetical protein